MKKLIVFILAFMLFSSIGKAQDRLMSGEELKFGTSGQAFLYSPSGEYCLFVAPQGQVSIARKYGTKWENIWYAQLDGQGPIKKVVMESDGNFAVYNYQKEIWSTKTQGNPGAWCVMQDDGNFIVVSKDRKGLWHTGTNK